MSTTAKLKTKKLVGFGANEVKQRSARTTVFHTVNEDSVPWLSIPMSSERPFGFWKVPFPPPELNVWGYACKWDSRGSSDARRFSLFCLIDSWQGPRRSVLCRSSENVSLILFLCALLLDYLVCVASAVLRSVPKAVKHWKWWRPTAAENPSVSRPELEPEVISMRPFDGLRKPSGPYSSKADDTEWREKWKTHWFVPFIR